MSLERPPVSDRYRQCALLAFGLALVTTPIWAPPLDVTGREYDYSAALVTVEDNRVAIPRESPRPTSIPNVDCFLEPVPSRLCAFESGVVGNRSVREPYPGVRDVTGEPPMEAPEPYVAFTGDGRVFERTVSWDDDADAYVLDLQRVNATKIVADAARPARRYPPPVRNAVETGTAQADEPLSEPVVVRSSGRYYVVYTTGSRTFLSEKPVTERLFEAGAVVGGAALLWRRGRNETHSA